MLLKVPCYPNSVKFSLVAPAILGSILHIRRPFSFSVCSLLVRTAGPRIWRSGHLSRDEVALPSVKRASRGQIIPWIILHLRPHLNMDYKSQTSLNAQQSLLKSSQPNYGSSSTANGAVAAESRQEAALVEPPTLPEGPMRVKQVFAALAVLLSGGAKLVHVWLHIYRQSLSLLSRAEI